MSRMILAGAVASTMLMTAAGAIAPAAPMSEDQVTRMVAPSPARELHRRWQECIIGVAEIARLNAQTDVSKIEELARVACSEAESRLTGELIKRHGYERGNAAIEVLKRKNRARFEEIVRAVTAKPEGYFSQVGEWTIFRNPDGRCLARISDGSAPFDHSSYLMQHQGQWHVTFVAQRGISDRYDAYNGKHEETQLELERDGAIIGTLRSELELGLGHNYFAWITVMPIDDARLSQMDAAKRIRFVALREEHHFPRLFPVTGIKAAWNEVRRCAATK